MLDYPPQYHWLFQYKLYHLPFWMIYHYLWWSLGIGSAWEAANSIFFSIYSVKFIFYVVFQAAGVYFNLYFLIPKFLEKGRYLTYISLLVLTLLSTAALIVTGYYAGALLSDQTFLELYQTEPGNYFSFFKNNSLPSTVASMTLAMSIKLTKNWIASQRRQQVLEKRQQALEKEKLETELKFLKSQFNPHFLFNTINSIFVLIHKNPNVASESLAKFSDLLRYQLYECNEAQIPLERELGYFENFVELEKLRQDHNFELTLHTKTQSTGNLIIAPFILMPFVENAFKHISQWQDQPNWIKINFTLAGRQLQLDIANSISTQPPSPNGIMQHAGIGLKNVKRRLDLLYPGQHHLVIEKEDAQFQIALRLNLQEHMMPAFMPVG